MKYHITDNGPKPCKDTKGLCPYAKAGDTHFSSQEEAQTAYETRMSEKFGNLSVNVKSTISPIQKKFSGLSKINKNDPIYKKINIAKSFKSDGASLNNKIVKSDNSNVKNLMKVKNAFS